MSTSTLDKLGYLHGKHYTEYVEIIEQACRNGYYDTAEKILLSLIDVIERESRATGYGVAPYYYEKLAIIYRKQKRTDEEINILLRFANQIHAPGVKPP